MIHFCCYIGRKLMEMRMFLFGFQRNKFVFYHIKRVLMLMLMIKERNWNNKSFQNQRQEVRRLLKDMMEIQVNQWHHLSVQTTNVPLANKGESIIDVYTMAVSIISIHWNPYVNMKWRNIIVQRIALCAVYLDLNNMMLSSSFIIPYLLRIYGFSHPRLLLLSVFEWRYRLPL